MALADVLREKKTPAVEGVLLEQDWAGQNSIPRLKRGAPSGVGSRRSEHYTGLNLSCSSVVASTGIRRVPAPEARATMQAIEAWQEGISLEEKAKTSRDLTEALEKWGHYKPV